MMGPRLSLLWDVEGEEQDLFYRFPSTHFSPHFAFQKPMQPPTWTLRGQWPLCSYCHLLLLLTTLPCLPILFLTLANHPPPHCSTHLPIFHSHPSHHGSDLLPSCHLPLHFACLLMHTHTSFGIAPCCFEYLQSSEFLFKPHTGEC